LQLRNSRLHGQQGSRLAKKGRGGLLCKKELPDPNSSSSTCTISAFSVSLLLAWCSLLEKLLRLRASIDFKKKVCSVFWETSGACCCHAWSAHHHGSPICVQSWSRQGFAGDAEAQPSASSK